ncbi:MAG: bis(5'-nucleosyl)-tetraphosphatase (symmetrical) YqeK [Candidatus Gastranaerophilales bacterium]|nr:bis(5'-nucleosyl)-tetraphosphatase (symmetrical) YqeK [Candidatus Gastranaerophilales bacterium]
MYTKYSIEEIKEKLEKTLSYERYIHSIGTMEKAMQLAEEFNSDIEKAQLAGLLHDCAKCLSTEELETFKDNFEEYEKLSVKTWHAPAGAFIARRDYAITDEQILSAIRWHTIGKKNMTDFEKIIFIADKIEPRTRETEFRQKIEKALNKRHNLNDAMLKSFKITIKSLLKRKLPICFQTVDVYNDLLKKTEE